MHIVIRADKRTQFLLWLVGSRLYTKAEGRAILLPLTIPSDGSWETPPTVTDPHECLPHRLSFTRLTAPANDGALSLLRYGAVLTGDRLPSSEDMKTKHDKDVDSTPWSRFVSERDVGINPTGDSFYLRNSASGLSTDDGSMEAQHWDAADRIGQVSNMSTTTSAIVPVPPPNKRAKVASS